MRVSSQLWTSFRCAGADRSDPSLPRVVVEDAERLALARGEAAFLPKHGHGVRDLGDVVVDLVEGEER